LPSGAKIVLFVGRLYPEKNPELFVETCDVLRQNDATAHAVLVGEGMLADVVRDRMRTRPWLHWIPRLTHSEVLDAMALSRVLVICSQYESGPLVLLEALGLGTPVVTVDVGRARELISQPWGRITAADAISLARGVHEVLELDRPNSVDASLRRMIDFESTFESLTAVLADAQHAEHHLGPP
jgi:glycosyltransferase involved in cell wall biosynthesis